MPWARKLGLKPGDFVIVGMVLLLAVGTALPFRMERSETLYAEIYQDNTLLRRIPLTDGVSETLTIEGAVTNQIEWDGKSIRFSRSTCPDQVCVRSGTLTRAGETAVCLPNRVMIRISGGEPEVDAIVGGGIH